MDAGVGVFACLVAAVGEGRMERMFEFGDCLEGCLRGEFGR